MSDCCNGKNVLLYACSGGANVGEIADRAARQLMSERAASMFCVAAIGGKVDDLVQMARDADVNLVIDGCPMDCSKKCFDNAGLCNYVHFRVTDLGIEKAKPKAATDDEVAKVVAKAREVLAPPCTR